MTQRITKSAGWAETTAEEVEQARKDQRLWEYLRKKLKPLDDNNATAKKIYQYLKQNYLP